MKCSTGLVARHVTRVTLPCFDLGRGISLKGACAKVNNMWQCRRAGNRVVYHDACVIFFHQRLTQSDTPMGAFAVQQGINPVCSCGIVVKGCEL